MSGFKDISPDRGITPKVQRTPAETKKGRSLMSAKGSTFSNPHWTEAQKAWNAAIEQKKANKLSKKRDKINKQK